LDAYADRFQAAMDDDFNTPEALAVLFELANVLNRARELGEPVVDLAATLREMGECLGILQDDPDSYLKGGSGAGGLSDSEIEALIDARRIARVTKDWAESDRVRDVLKDQGVILEDGPQGTTWRRASKV
jgi:cysteinyl-tRNA synthetase